MALLGATNLTKEGWETPEPGNRLVMTKIFIEKNNNYVSFLKWIVETYMKLGLFIWKVKKKCFSERITVRLSEKIIRGFSCCHLARCLEIKSSRLCNSYIIFCQENAIS